jgi:hypothetical protein
MDGHLAGIRVMRGRRFKDLVLAKIKPMVFAENVQGTVPADGVKPRFEIVPHAARIGKVEPE